MKPCRNPLCILGCPPPHHHDDRKGKGYPRIHQRGMWRNWYLHHWVIYRVSKGRITPDTLRAEGLEVHHMDFNSGNPCPYNLLIIPKAIHILFRNGSNTDMDRVIAAKGHQIYREEINRRVRYANGEG